MLSIGLMAGGQESYYASLAHEDYFLRGGEPPGAWWGRGASALGLSGRVEKEELSNLFRGYSADGSKRLVRNAGKISRRAGFDLTFSAEKSVSAAWAAATPEIKRVIGDCHARAVSKALSYVEEECGMTRKGTDGAEAERTGLTVAVFGHSTSRAVGHDTAPDPQIHTHCLVLNASPNGYALDGREFFRHKMTAGALYRAELFAELERHLGLQSSKVGRFARLDIVPEALRAEFSKRRNSILHFMGEIGGGDARKAAQSALLTRDRKTQVDRAELEPRWRATCSRHGLQLDEDRVARLRASTTERDVARLLREGIASALERVTASSSHFAKRELIRFVAEQLENQGVGVTAIRTAVNAELEDSPEIVPLGELKRESRYTTREMLRLEEWMIDQVEDLHARAHSVDEGVLGGVLAARESITGEQRKALRHLTQGSAVACLQGFAGTGKTYLLDAARDAWERSGLRVVGCSLASIAARRLESGAAIESTSIHKTLSALDRGRAKLDAKTVLVIDEAGMVGTRLMSRLVAHVHAAGAKLVLAGDSRQLQAIEAGAPFTRISRDHGAASLESIIRQSKGWAREAVKRFASGEAAKAIQSFKDRGLFSVERTRADAMEKLVSEWNDVPRAKLKETLVLCGTRLEASLLNRQIQQVRYQEGELGERYVVVGGQHIFQGDRVLFRRNSTLVANGDAGVVTGANQAENTLTVKLDRGERVTVDIEVYQEVQLGYASTTHAAQGATVDNCFVLCGGSMQDREATYVQASRARVVTRLYTDEASAGEELADLVKDMKRSRAKSMAVDVIEQKLEPV